MTLDEARSELLSAALTITTDTWNDVHLIKNLCEAASAYAAARTSSAPSRPAVASSGAAFRFGRLKGQALRGSDLKDLEWYAGALRKSISDPEKARFLESNEAELAQVDAELAGR